MAGHLQWHLLTYDQLALAKLRRPGGTWAGLRVTALMEMVRKGVLFEVLWRWCRSGGCSGGPAEVPAWLQ